MTELYYHGTHYQRGITHVVCCNQRRLQTVDTELELRLTELEQPHAQGKPLDLSSFIKLTILTVALPVVFIVIGWMLIV